MERYEFLVRPVVPERIESVVDLGRSYRRLAEQRTNVRVRVSDGSFSRGRWAVSRVAERTGARVPVLRYPVDKIQELSVESFEAARGIIVDVIDALDAVSPWIEVELGREPRVRPSRSWSQSSLAVSEECQRALWREELGLPMGERGPGLPLGSRIPTALAKVTGANFMSPGAQAAALREVLAMHAGSEGSRSVPRVVQASSRCAALRTRIGDLRPCEPHVGRRGKKPEQADDQRSMVVPNAERSIENAALLPR